MTPRPMLKVWRDPKAGKLWFKHWAPRSRWRGPCAHLGEVSELVHKEAGTVYPYEFDFVEAKA